MLRELARAKVNLDLLVTGRRPDGYHELDSLVAFADFGDELTIESSTDLTLELTGPFAAGLCAGEDNLVLRAARKLAAVTGIHPIARLRLDKQLPVAAGLGGGSADAAAALRGLRRHWRLPLDDAALAEIGLGLGADVPVCLLSRPVRMRGIGELIEPMLGLPELNLLLVNPGCPLATAAVFRELSLSAIGPRSVEFPSAPGLDWLARSRNVLEFPARGLLQDIGVVLTALAGIPGCRLARMSGSGATCFGLFDKPAQAKWAAATIARDHPNWWVVACVVGTAICG